MDSSRPVIHSTGSVVRVDRGVVADVKATARARPDGRFRLCLHHEASDRVQQMLLVHPAATYVRPHMHAGQAQSIHAIEGAILVVVFDDGGRPAQRIRLAPGPSGQAFMVRIEPAHWHTEIPLDDPAVVLETFPGPFRAESHNIFAPWAPDPADRPAVERFLKSVMG